MATQPSLRIWRMNDSAKTDNLLSDQEETETPRLFSEHAEFLYLMKLPVSVVVGHHHPLITPRWPDDTSIHSNTDTPLLGIKILFIYTVVHL